MHGQPLSAAWNAAGILHRLDQLAACTEEPGVITRRFLTPAHAEAISMVRGWMHQAGLQTRLDASGTLIGRRGHAAPLLVVASHIDTVRNAGRYDGCLGVLLGIAAAANLANTGLAYALEIRAFGDEEGLRFPVTLTGAHAAAARFNPAWLEASDSDGITLGAARSAFGLNPEEDPAATGIFAYLEAHIEQGPVLEAAGAPLGVVTAINGAARFTATLTGQAGHAGTVPMHSRSDALVAAAAMVGAVRAAAQHGVVATVGQLTVLPNAANVIPGQCTFSIDLRAPTDALRDAAEKNLTAELQALAAANHTHLALVRTHAAPAVACDPRLQSLLAEAITQTGALPLHLPSGAGHDAMAMAAACPIGMLFIRCAGGISHHPDEAVTEPDVAAALAVLETALRRITPAQFQSA